MNILIIGCNGFIGNNLFRFYTKQENVEVFGCDISEDSNQNYFQITTSTDCFEQIFKTKQFDYCINASGAANVSESLKDPLKDYELNTVNVFKMLEAIRKYNPQCKFLNLSSAAVYGNPLQLPVSEKDILSPMSPYGLHKMQAEQLCHSFYTYWGVSTCSIRIFSAYGPGLKKQLFWDIAQKAKMMSSIVLFGTGKETRDFIFIEDILQVIDLVIKQTTFTGECINVANGEQVTIKEASSIFYKILGVTAPVNFNNETRPGDPLHWEADISKIKALGYKQQYSIEMGLTEYAKWLKEGK